MAKRGKMNMEKMCKCKAIAMIVFGLLVIGNAYWGILDWATFIGGAIILAGVMKLFMPHKHMGMMHY